MSSWSVRGSKPGRNAQAALLGGALGFIDALVNGKPRPWVYLGTHAIGSALAMNEHRIAARAATNERNTSYAATTGDLLNIVGDALEAAPKAQVSPPSFSDAYTMVANAWNATLNATRLPPASVEVPASVWFAMTEQERASIIACARQHGVGVSYSGTLRVLAHPRRPLLHS
jgi:hypothetical protein